MNITYEHKIVSEERRGVGAKPGHDLVVFEIVDHGLRFERVVKEGDTFVAKRKGLFSSLPEYASYAVNMNPVQRFKFTDRFNHMTPGRSFDLTFTLCFCVITPSLIVQRLNDDPLKMLRNEIKRTIGGAVSKKTWEIISRNKQEENFATIAEDVYTLHKSELEKFASEFGIGLKEIDIALGMTAEDVAPIMAVTELERKIKLAESEDKLKQAELERSVKNESAKIESEMVLTNKRQDLLIKELSNEHERRTIQTKTKIMESGAEAFTTAIHNIASETRTPDTLARSVEAVSRIFEVTRDTTSLGQRQAVEYRKDKDRLFLQAGDQIYGLESVLKEVLNEFGSTSERSMPHRRLLAAILHWLAEFLIQTDIDSTEMELWRSKLTNLPDDITPSQYLLVSKLLDIDELRSRLS